ncbi:MAG TPA: secretin N-terminal domain-containing protein, partial [Bryobacteraceae bacterium]|nr:secretin N-terminal domain-containing protein [Bryobacteraceae bacterium]
MRFWISTGTMWVVLAAVALAQQKQPEPIQVVPPPGFGPRVAPPARTGTPKSKRTKPQREQSKPAAESAKPEAQPIKPETQPAKAEAKPEAGQPGAAPAQPAPQEVAPVKPGPVTLSPTPSGRFVLNLENASLIQVIEILTRRLKLNYILDPRVNVKGGGITLNTFGELKEVDIRALLDTILRMNGAAMVQVGELHRIVPLTEITRMPLSPQVDPKSIPEDERVVLNLIFLKYATVTEMAKILEKFLGEGAVMVTYEPANLLLVLDNNRNMRRTMELVALFDSGALASQRVRLFEVKNNRPSDLVKDLETVLQGASLTGKLGGVRFLALDRINTIIAVAPNPGVFEEVEKWLGKLDVAVKTTAGATDNYVYRVKYGRAPMLATAIMHLYLGIPFSGFGYGGGMYGGGMYGGGRRGGYGGYGGFDGGGYGGYGGGYGGYGGGYGGYGGGYGMPGGYGGYGRGGYGGYGRGYPGSGYGGVSPYMMSSGGIVPPPAATGTAGTVGATAGAQQALPSGAATSPDMTGSYLGSWDYGLPEGIPRIVPNPLDNSLLIQATPQQYEQILKLLRDLDVPPRQVLIEAKIYEVSLTGAFAGGVKAYLQRKGATGTGAATFGRILQGTTSGAGLTLTAGMLVGESRELLGILTAQETQGKTRLISAPSVIATDSIPASINVGQEVPTLASQAVTGAQQAGT